MQLPTSITPMLYFREGCGRWLQGPRRCAVHRSRTSTTELSIVPQSRKTKPSTVCLLNPDPHRLLINASLVQLTQTLENVRRKLCGKGQTPEVNGQLNQVPKLQAYVHWNTWFHDEHSQSRRSRIGARGGCSGLIAIPRPGARDHMVLNQKASGSAACGSTWHGPNSDQSAEPVALLLDWHWPL